MRIPKSPPAWTDVFSGEPAAYAALFEKLNSDGVKEFVGKTNDEYLHWDKLRRYPMPAGIAPNEMWVAVYMSRSAQFRHVELSLDESQKFKYWTPPRHQEWLHRIDQDAGGFIGSRSRLVPRDSEDRFLFNSLMEEAIASSQLEGSSTTREVAKRMLRTNRRPRNTHEQMILNNYLAILEIREAQKQELTPELLCHIHEVITENTLSNSTAAGRFRTPEDQEVVVEDAYTQEVLFKPPRASSVKWRIDELCAFANEKSRPFIHPVVKAILLHFAIGYIHPFLDGNGRTARAIFYWFMLKSGYWIFEYLPISRIVLDSPGRYAKAYLYTETDGGDATYFIHYNLRIIDRAVREMIRYFEHQQELLHQVREMVDSLDLNHRQLAAAYHAIQDPHSSFTVKQHAGTHNVVQATARADLFGLESAGILSRRKDGKCWVFVPAQHLKRKLQKGAFRKTHKRPESVVTTVARTAPHDAQESAEAVADDQPLLPIMEDANDKH